AGAARARRCVRWPPRLRQAQLAAPAPAVRKPPHPPSGGECGVRAAAARRAGVASAAQRWAMVRARAESTTRARRPRTQLKGLHVEAVKLVAQAVGQLIAFALQVLVYAREFPELDHLRIVQPHAAKAGLIGA